MTSAETFGGNFIQRCTVANATTLLMMIKSHLNMRRSMFSRPNKNLSQTRRYIPGKIRVTWSPSKIANFDHCVPKRRRRDYSVHSSTPPPQHKGKPEKLSVIWWQQQLKLCLLGRRRTAALVASPSSSAAASGQSFLIKKVWRWLECNSSLTEGLSFLTREPIMGLEIRKLRERKVYH